MIGCEINGVKYRSVAEAMRDLGLSRYKINKILVTPDGAYGLNGKKLA